MGATLSIGLTLATPAEATRFSNAPLSGLSSDGNVLFFTQPDDSGTTLDLETGRVIERGAVPRGMPLASLSCGDNRVCPMATGVLELHPSPGVRFRVLSPDGAVIGESRHERLPIPSGAWEVKGKLLLDIPSYGGGFALECFDLASHETKWIYVYSTALAGRSSYAVRRVEAAREEMRRFSEFVGPGLPTIDDPDPRGAAWVARQVLLAKIILLGLTMATGALAWAGTFRPKRASPWLGVLVTSAAGFVFAAGQFLEPNVYWAGGVLFMASWVIARSLANTETPARGMLTFVSGISLCAGGGLPLLRAVLLGTLR